MIDTITFYTETQCRVTKDSMYPKDLYKTTVIVKVELHLIWQMTKCQYFNTGQFKYIYTLQTVVTIVIHNRE